MEFPQNSQSRAENSTRKRQTAVEADEGDSFLSNFFGEIPAPEPLHPMQQIESGAESLISGDEFYLAFAR
jgi:hypothetical protein